jgi:cytochrome b pre-mRNA-processing protein 3
MILARWRARRANRILIEQIHGEIVAAARAPALYAQWAVPDTLDGRFEMVALHAGLAMRRLAQLGDVGSQIAQDLVDCVFRHFEDALREMALGDAGVVKRMKAMIESFYGRNRAYAEALDARDDERLAAALARNVYNAAAIDAAPQARDLASYVRRTAAALETSGIDAFSGGRFRYPQGDTQVLGGAR